MDRSLGFGSMNTHCVARFGLAFATPPVGLTTLSLRVPITRRFIMQKARRHSVRELPLAHGAPTACRLMISGSISLPFRGSFRLSLAVLVHYRSSTRI